MGHGAGGTSTARGPALQRPHRPARGRQGVTVLDDGTVTTAVDRSTWTTKTASQRNVLIEDGILKRLHPGFAQRPPDGRGPPAMGGASYAHLPPRMTNTYMLGATRIRRKSSPASRRAVRQQLWWWAGGHHLGQVRVFCQLRPTGWKTARSSTRQGRHHRGQRPESLKR